MNPIIVISGGAGTGKSTAAKAVAKKFKLRHVSAGDKMRELARELGFSIKGSDFVKFQDYVKNHKEIDKKLDELIIQDVSKGGCVVDSRLAAYLINNPTFKIFLRVPNKISAERISLREKIPFNEALQNNLERTKKELTRYKKLYRIDINDLSTYDLILDTSNYPIKEMNEVIIYAIKKKLENN